MSNTAYSVCKAIQGFSCRDPTLKCITLSYGQHTDSELSELVDCLLVHPNVITEIYLGGNELTDETGVKLARYVAISSTIKWLNLSNNQFGSTTYLALAAALRFNSSLRGLYLHNNQVISIEDQSRIDAAFVDTLVLNCNLSALLRLWLYDFDYDQNELRRLRNMAKQLGHPNMQALLAMHIFRSELVRI